ncbi:MAG: phosphonate dehydrogenase [Streptosporangiaceae bacterium]|nr:phosphonate dehydrogenase [Streptosporangiaceae bacterium]
MGAENRPRVVVTHWVHPEIAEYLASFCDPVLPAGPGQVFPPGKAADLAADATGLITGMSDRVDEAFLAGCPRLRVISATLKGYDNFDADACARRGVWLAILPDLLTVPTAELAVGLIIGVMRRVAEADREMRQGTFAGWRPRLYGAGLDGATAGFVGMGQVGRAVARRLGGFGTRIVYCDPRPVPPGTVFPGSGAEVTRLGLDQLLELSDVVVLALPLTAGTRHLLGAEALARMRPGAFLVNVGRGSVVDEDAVAAALVSGQLGGYAADVFAMEDWALPDRPRRIPPRLLAHPRTLFTPHLGSAVDAVRRQMSREAARQVHQVLRGEHPDHAVNEPARSGPAP